MLRLLKRTNREIRKVFIRYDRGGHRPPGRVGVTFRYRRPRKSRTDLPVGTQSGAGLDTKFVSVGIDFVWIESGPRIAEWRSFECFEDSESLHELTQSAMNQQRPFLAELRHR